MKTHLGTFAVVFVLACELLPFESVKDFGDRLGRLGQHGFEGDTFVKSA
jgi:lauroyl/myristoyl acyltransferase